MSTQTNTTPPHPEIEVVSANLLDIYKQQRSYLASKDTNYLSDLLAASLDVARHEDFSVRVGAEVNRTAATMILEERGKR